MDEINSISRPDPRPVDYRHVLPAGVTQRSSASAETSVLDGLGFKGGK